MSKKEFYSGTKNDIVERIKQYLPYVLNMHRKNAAEFDYLYDIYRGIQPILNKSKVVRPEINHIVLENHAFEIVEFKKSYIYGEPIQYVQKGEKEIEKSNSQISALNQYMELISKPTEDKQIAEWQYVGGTGYRYVGNGDEETPFTLSVPDPRKTFVVYSNSIKEEVLFSGFLSEKLISEMTTSEPNNAFNQKRKITIYTDDMYIEFDAEGVASTWTFTPKQQKIPFGSNLVVDAPYYPLLPKGNRIVEYPLNNARIGLVELILTAQNAINQIKSNNVDDIDQFVQSLLVFINQEVDPKTYQNLIKLGAIEVMSQDPRKTRRCKDVI